MSLSANWDGVRSLYLSAYKLTPSPGHFSTVRPITDLFRAFIDFLLLQVWLARDNKQVSSSVLVLQN
jgi:hypothetical protein